MVILMTVIRSGLRISTWYVWVTDLLIWIPVVRWIRCDNKSNTLVSAQNVQAVYLPFTPDFISNLQKIDATRNLIFFALADVFYFYILWKSPVTRHTKPQVNNAFFTSCFRPAPKFEHSLGHRPHSWRPFVYSISHRLAVIRFVNIIC